LDQLNIFSDQQLQPKPANGNDFPNKSISLHNNYFNNIATNINAT